jgi:hypothetical protein
MEKEPAKFELIIEDLNQASLEDASREFSKSFGLEQSIAARILKALPIVFLTEVTRSELKALTPRLLELSSKGLTFRVTAQSTQNLPKVTWPIRPNFVIGSVQHTDGISFDWGNNAFVCPGCGETFLFKRLGKLYLGPQVQPAPPAPSPLQQPPEPVTTKLVPETQPAGILAEEEPVEITEEDLPVLEPLEELPSEPATVETAAPVPEEQKVESAEVSKQEIIEEEIIETPLEEEPQKVEPPPVEVEDKDLYNVFLPGVSMEKRKEVAELISKIRGVSMVQAHDLARRAAIPLLKGVTKEQAERALGQFKRLGIIGKITRVIKP